MTDEPENAIRLEPKTKIENIVDKAMSQIEEDAKEAGGEIKQMVVICYAEGLGEQDTVTAGNGFQDPTEVLAFLMAECKMIANQIGLDMNVEMLPPDEEPLDPMEFLNQEEQE
jgi:hypothetical protein